MNGRPFLQVFFWEVGGIDLILEVRRLRRVSSWEVRATHQPSPPTPVIPTIAGLQPLARK